MKIRAVRITAAGGPEVLEIQDAELRAPGPDELVIDVHATGLNRADCLQRKGVYPAPKGVAADIPGLEYSGTVNTVGERAALNGDWSVGDRVMGITAGGSMATQIVCHARECIPVPACLSLDQAAAVPEVFLTAFDALVRTAGLRSGDRVLLHAAGSGIGTAAAQIVKALGATSIGTSRTREKLDRALTLGLDHAVYSGGPVDPKDRAGYFAGAVRELGSVHIILDTIGAKYLAENIRVLAPGGTLVVIGLLGGVKTELNLGLLLSKRATIVGSVLRSRPLEEKITLALEFRSQMLPLFARGLLKPVIDEVLPMEKIRAAHTRMEAGETFGKLVMKW